MTEKELIIKAKAGDEESFCEIIKLFEKKVANTIYFMIKDENKVEDVAQEVFIKVYKNIKKFNEQSSLYTWIYRITINCCLDEIRKEKKIISSNEYVLRYDDEEKEVEIEDTNANVEDKIIESLDRETLIIAIKRLPDEQRALIVLRDIKGFSYYEIAEMLDIKLGTVKSRISRARATLKEELTNLGYTNIVIEE